MKNSEKFILPVSLIGVAVIIGGSFVFIQIEKQSSIEKQQELKLSLEKEKIKGENNKLEILKVEKDRNYVAKRKNDCLDIYKAEGKKWDNVNGYKYNIDEDKCYFEYKNPEWKKGNIIAKQYFWKTFSENDSNKYELKTIIEQPIVDNMIKYCKNLATEKCFLDNDFKINDLGEIKEYYKTVTGNGGDPFYHTAYFKGTDLLYFISKSSIYGTKLYLIYPEEKEIDILDGFYQQPIFSSVNQNKIIIPTELDYIELMKGNIHIRKIWKLNSGNGNDDSFEDYIQIQNKDGVILKNKKGEKIYLGNDCDALYERYGKGTWEWGNGGFIVRFIGKNFGFPRQELNIKNGGKCLIK